VDGQDNVYVTDVGDPVHKLSSTGAPLALVHVAYTGDPNFPGGVAVDQQGNLYTAEGGANVVDKTSPAGQPLARWGSAGSGPGQFEKPSGIALDAAGNVYVTDMGNNRVEELSATGQFIAQWGGAGTAPGQFNSPTGIAVDQQGDVYVSDALNSRVQKLSAALSQPPVTGQGPPAGSCQFVLGFKALHDLIPNVVDDCLDNEAHNPANGDALQHTTNGLLVWRAADNWTAFTDGYHTWVNGPNGVQERLNTERFPWEASSVAAPPPPETAQPPAALPPAPVLQYPANGTTVGTKFSWTPVPEAIQYDFEYWTSSPCEPNRTSAILSPAQVPLQGFGAFWMYGSPYYWHVRAHTPAGWGPWSDTWSVIAFDGPENRCEYGPNGWHVTSWQPH